MDPESQLPTILTLPASLPYPITITKLLVSPGQKVVRGQKLLTYSYSLIDREMPTIDSTEFENDADKDGNGEGRVESGGRKEPLIVKARGSAKVRKAGGDWDSELEGEVAQWGEEMKVGAVLTTGGQKAIYIQEPCSHPVVFSGLCAVCGKDLESMQDYLDSNSPFASTSAGHGPTSGASFNEIIDDSYRGGLAIDHEDSRVKVSVEEAHRLALTHRHQLLDSHKLIMVVDLDQTVIHAAVDPTIGEWLNECGFWESSRLGYKKQHHGQREEQIGSHDGLKSEELGGSGVGQSGKGKEKETIESSEDKKKKSNPNREALRDVFRFQLPNELPPGYGKGRFSQKLPEEDGDGCWYYIKPRPGLGEFLKEMSELYELHVYTAGSRTYANAVCKGIDPDGKYFGDRILSRDESGNAAQKTLMRLFPTDQSMVVVIDDRYEVWNHAANLVKVVPYDFFVGMGDINSAFVAPRAIDETPTRMDTSGSDQAHPEGRPMDVAVGLDAEAQEILEQAQVIEEQLTERPLAKMQAELEKEAKVARSTTPEVEPNTATAPADGTEMSSSAKALLKASDGELPRLQHILREIYGRFFTAFGDNKEGYRIPPSMEPTPNVMYDVRHIIPYMQRKILAGCIICFSGIVPLNQRPEQNEHWLLATTFGAKCTHHLTSKVTHLVAAQADTQKVYQAHRLPNTKVVWKEWLRHSIDMWQRQDEGPYLIPRPSKDEKATSSSAVDGVPTAPPTPSSAGDPLDIGEEDMNQDGHLHLDVLEDDIDAEMNAFLAESDSEAGSDDGKMRGSVATPSRKRSRPSGLANEISASSSTTPDGGYEVINDKPLRKRARFAADDGDFATEFADVEEEWDEENYDEYSDEDRQPSDTMEELEVPVDGLLSEGVAADDGESGLAATEQLALDLARGNEEDAKSDGKLQGSSHAND